MKDREAKEQKAEADAKAFEQRLHTLEAKLNQQNLDQIKKAQEL